MLHVFETLEQAFIAVPADLRVALVFPEKRPVFLAARCYYIIDCSRHIIRYLLRKDCCSYIATAVDGAGIGYHAAGKELHERGFSGAVTAKQADSFTRFNLE